MYNIVSANVIRASLRNMTAPRPKHIAVSKSVITSVGGVQLQQYTVEFDSRDMNKYLRALGKGNAYPRSMAVTEVLQECFCNDVQVIQADYKLNKPVVVVNMLVTLTAKDDE